MIHSLRLREIRETGVLLDTEMDAVIGMATLLATADEMRIASWPVLDDKGELLGWMASGIGQPMPAVQRPPAKTLTAAIEDAIRADSQETTQ